MKTKRLLWLLFIVTTLVSCRGMLTTHENDIAVYAPNNTVEVKTITQTRDKKTVPLVEQISDGKLHYVISEILTTDPGAIFFPDMDYNFYVTASNESEYYVFGCVPYIYVNDTKGFSIESAFETYGPNVIMNAIKEQSPNSVIIVSSTQEQKIQGSLFHTRSRVINLTIAE